MRKKRLKISRPVAPMSPPVSRVPVRDDSWEEAAGGIGGNSMTRIQKLWGFEDVLYNVDYCMKVLNLNPDYQSSLHYHVVKHETFLVIYGECDLEFDNVTRQLDRGDYQVIPPGTKHRFRAINGLCIIAEASSHHSDDDVIRIDPSRAVNEV